MFTYAYRCTQVGLKSIKKKKEEEKRKEKGLKILQQAVCSFEALYLIKIQTHTVFPNVTELLTFAYRK